MALDGRPEGVCPAMPAVDPGRLRAARVAAGLSRTEAGHAIGKSYPAMETYERGAVVPARKRPGGPSRALRRPSRGLVPRRCPGGCPVSRRADVCVTDAGLPIGHRGPLNCPACGEKFTGQWSGCHRADQRCPACGDVFRATWRGWSVKTAPGKLANVPR